MLLQIFLFCSRPRLEREKLKRRERETQKQNQKKKARGQAIGWLVGRPAEAGSRARQAVQRLSFPERETTRLFPPSRSRRYCSYGSGDGEGGSSSSSGGCTQEIYACASLPLGDPLAPPRPSSFLLPPPLLKPRLLSQGKREGIAHGRQNCTQRPGLL